MVKLQTILWNSCDNRCWHTCSTEEDTVFPWPWNGCDNDHGTTVTSSVEQLWQKRMIPLRQQLHHNLKTFYILVVLLVLLFPCYLGLFVVITYNKYFKYARKPQKMMASYHKNPCKRVVLALFSEHLSASENHNILIYSIFKSHADSDRCFSTFIFLIYAIRHRGDAYGRGGRKHLIRTSLHCIFYPPIRKYWYFYDNFL